tara:strand:+ start:6768 stop:7763 length:996 start_codon:yes stop_codon:yes gene_type:complete
MSSNHKKQLLIVLIDKYNITNYKKDIPDNIEYIEDLNKHVIDNSWIDEKKMEKKPFFLYLNSGEIIPNETKLDTIFTDIMLLVYTSINYVKRTFPDTFPNVTNISSNLENTDTPIGYNILSNIPSSITTPQIPVFTFNIPGTSDTSSLSDQTSQLSEAILGNLSSTTSNLSSNIANIISSLSLPSSTMNVNTDQDIEDDGVHFNDTPHVESQESEMTLIEPLIPTTNNDEISSNNEDPLSNDDSDNNGTVVNNQTINIPDQLQNIYQQTLNTFNYANSFNYTEIKEKYSEEYEHMKQIGFIDDNKILEALYICDGNIENSVNYYLAQVPQH